MHVRSLALVAVAAGLLGCDRPEVPSHEGPLSGSRSSAPVVASARPEARHMVKLDYTLAITDPGKPAVNTTYTVNVEENSKGEVRQSRNVPLQTSAPGSASGAARPPGAPSGPAPRPAMAAARQDIGLLLRATINLAGDDVTVHTDFEMSDIDESPVAKIYKVSLKGDALIGPGKTATVATSEDPTTHRRYQLSVTATRLR